MNTFIELVKFELKKVFCRKRTIIVLALVIIVGGLSTFGTVIGGKVYYSDEDGNELSISRYEDEMIDRRNGEALSGRVLDADLIMEAVNAYRTIPLADGNYTATPEYQSNARRYSEIYNIVRMTLNLNGVKSFCNLTREQAEQFDEIRRENRLNAVTELDISDSMREYWLKCFDESPDTITYEYSGGYYRYIIVMYSTALLIGTALAIMFSGIFSSEYTNGTDSLILTSKHGKGLVIGAKLFTIFISTLMLTLLLMLITLVGALAVWGSHGAGAPFELISSYDNIFPYPFTIGQSAAIYSVCTLASCLFTSAITAMLSALLKNPFNTVVIMAVLLIAPMFIDVSAAPIWIFELFTLLPSNMAALGYALGSYQFELFGVIIPNFIFLPIFAAAGSCLCSFIAYRGFRKHQIN